MNIVNLPGFTAESSVYRSRRHYQSARMLGIRSISDVDPAQLAPQLANCPCQPGPGSCVIDTSCSLGGSRRRINCDCSVGPKTCCTPQKGNGGGGWTDCGDHDCPPGATCSGPGCCPPDCCPPGAYPCSDGQGCCPDGSSCGSLFGWNFCIPDFF
jgi:hypothetical protein